MLRVADYVRRTDRGRQRPANEDSAHAWPPLFVVADGMGGAQAGEVASSTAVEVFRPGLPDGPGSDEERLAALVGEANARIHALALRDDQRAGMGTTLTAAYVGEHELAVAHVGDSRLYRLRDGTLEQLTEDHSLVGELVRRGQLSAAEAEEHPQRSIITRALGPEDEVAVDRHSWPARDGDVFLLCSDGLTSMVPDPGIAALLAEGGTLEETAERLVHAANDAGGRDNITVVLFRVEEFSAPGAEAATGEAPAVAPLDAPTREERAVPPAEAPAREGTSSAVAQRVPRAPRPIGEAPPKRRRRRWIAPTVVVVILLAMVGSALWIATRGVYFVGTDEQGFVTLYQGLPWELPGLALYQDKFTSGVPAEGLPVGVQRTVTDHELRSYDDAVDLVRQLERGALAGQ